MEWGIVYCYAQVRDRSLYNRTRLATDARPGSRSGPNRWRIDEMPVVDGADRPMGMMDLQDLVARGSGNSGSVLR